MGKRSALNLTWSSETATGGYMAYIFLKDGTFVNAWLVENGYAMVMTVPPNVKHQDLFLKLQRAAREERRGLWR